MCRKISSQKIKLSDSEPVNFCKPSINVMLDNLQEVYRGNILTVLLTGMGEDGKDACKRMKELSSSNIFLAQNKETSVVWGIPGAIVKAGICHDVLSVESLARRVNELCSQYQNTVKVKDDCNR